jgi:Putative adhesin
MRRLVAGGAVLLLAAACSPPAAEARTERRSSSYPGVTELVVDHRAGSVTVVRGDHVEVDRTVTGTAHRSPAERIEQNGSKLTVGASCPSFRGADACAVDYRITAPGDVAVTVRAAANPVTVAGLAAPVDVTTDSGAIRFDGIDADVRATTKAGRIIINQDRAAQIVARSDSGSVSIDGPGPVVASATSGDIRVAVAGGRPCDVTTFSASGRAEVHVRRENTGIPIDVRTDSGDITVVPA